MFSHNITAMKMVDAERFQHVTVKEDGEVEVTEPVYGRMLYAFGWRTDLGGLREHVLQVLPQLGENEEALAWVKAVSKCVKLEAVKAHKKRIEAALARDMKPREELRIAGMSGKEKMRQNVRLKRNETYRETRAEYKAIEKHARGLNPDPARRETFSYYRFDGELEEGMFQAYRLNPEQKMMVHATWMTEVPRVIDTIQDRESPQPYLCASLVDARTRFWHSDCCEDRVALILSIDPRQIVLTSDRDIDSPTVKRNGNLIETFYNIQERLLTVAYRIDQIHRLSGLEDIYRQLFTFDTLYEQSRKKLIELQASLHPPLEQMAALKAEIERLHLLCVAYLEKIDALSQQMGVEPSMQEWHACIQLNQVIQHYIMHPELNSSPEEFRKIFHYEGSGIVEELRHYAHFFYTLNNESLALHQEGASHLHCQILEKPQELLSQTEEYSEINVKLNAEHTRPTEVQGLLLSRVTLDAHTNGGVDKYCSVFADLINLAKRQQLPIFILENRQPRAKL